MAHQQAYAPPTVYQQQAPGYGYPQPGYGQPPAPYGQAYGQPYGQPPPAYGAAAPPYGYSAPPQQPGSMPPPGQPGAAPAAGSSHYPGISTDAPPAWNAPSAAGSSQPAQASAPSAPSAPAAPSAPGYSAPDSKQGAGPAPYGASTYSAPGAPPYGAPPYGAPAPAPAAYAPPPMPVAQGPQRKAVLVGCSYPRTNAELKGCINDIQCMKHMLTTRFGFQESNIVMLRDDVYHPDFYSTRGNIYRAIQWLMMDLRPGTSLFFHYSGHGNQKQDFSGDESDGMDETILPTDYKQAGQILDDELNQLLVNPLPPGVTLHAVIDACHSGTVMDLPYRTKMKPGRGMAWKGQYRPNKATRGGTCLQFGACRDSQTAADTNAMSGTVNTGAATFSFIQAIERGGTQQSYAQVLAAMSVSLEPNGPAPSTGFFGILLGIPSSGQTPVLSCDKPLDLNTRLML